MIAIICRSEHLASSIAGMLPREHAQWCTPGMQEEPGQWLASLLSQRPVSVVFYEPSFFIDPAPYRHISPATRFVVLASPGEESEGLRSLSYGASAFLGKPVDESSVHGVFQLVSC